MLSEYSDTSILGLSATAIRYLDNQSNIINEHFRVIDEAKDCLSLFDKLNETPAASWDYMYEEAKRYYEQNENLNAPAEYKTIDAYSLGDWFRTQRNKRLHRTLSNDRIKRLNKIGMDWLLPLARNWEIYFSAYNKYYMTYGNLEIGTTYTDENGLCIGMAWKNTDTADVVNASDSKLIQKDELRSYAA